MFRNVQRFRFHPQNTMIEIQERYQSILDAEAQWGNKWKQLVDLLVSNDAS